MEYICYIVRKSDDKDYLLTIHCILVKISEIQNWLNNDKLGVLILPLEIFLGVFP